MLTLDFIKLNLKITVSMLRLIRSVPVNYTLVQLTFIARGHKNLFNTRRRRRQRVVIEDRSVTPE